jgi:hypothetical protein
VIKSLIQGLNCGKIKQKRTIRIPRKWDFYCLLTNGLTQALKVVAKQSFGFEKRDKLIHFGMTNALFF